MQYYVYFYQKIRNTQRGHRCVEVSMKASILLHRNSKNEEDRVYHAVYVLQRQHGLGTSRENTGSSNQLAIVIYSWPSLTDLIYRTSKNRPYYYMSLFCRVSFWRKIVCLSKGTLISNLAVRFCFYLAVYFCFSSLISFFFSSLQVLRYGGP